MVKKAYTWADGAVLEEHSRRKHKILREYFYTYIVTRCQLPQRERFRLAVADCFAGAGRYGDGTAGSPIIFVEELRNATTAINAKRRDEGLSKLEVECLLVLNDADPDAVALLRSHIAPLQAGIAGEVPELHLRVEYLNQPFERAYPGIKQLLHQGRFRNVMFNLDQCGHSHVEQKTLLDIMRSYPSAEIFYTFAIQALIAFLRATDPKLLAVQLNYLGIESKSLTGLEEAMNKKSWLGVAERIVFEAFRACAPFVSPFSINNPDGWRYWLIHFANSYRARQVYNNTLHQNSSAQAHFGRSGLNMLSYDPSSDGSMLYLFDEPGRHAAKDQLLEDIPRLISESGDAIGVGEFYESIYNVTPAHTDDIHAAIIENPDIEVITPAGGKRRMAGMISVNDILKLRDQKSFFPVFLSTGAKRGGAK